MGAIVRCQIKTVVELKYMSPKRKLAVTGAKALYDLPTEWIDSLYCWQSFHSSAIQNKSWLKWRKYGLGFARHSFALPELEQEAHLSLTLMMYPPLLCYAYPLVNECLQISLLSCDIGSASDFAFRPHAQQQQVKCKKTSG